MNKAFNVNTKVLTGASLEKALLAKLREILDDVSWIRGWTAERHPTIGDRSFDFVVKSRRPKAEFWVQCKADPRPAQFPDIFVTDREVGISPSKVLASQRMSPRMAEVCEENGWGWFDLAGNHHLDVPGLLRLRHTGNKSAIKRPRPTANLGTPEAGRVIRALLDPENAGMRWTQRLMQTHCQPNVSLGLVNKVARHLREEAYVESCDEGGFQLRDPLKLLFAWRDAYRFERHERHGYFTLLQGRQLRDELAKLDGIPGGDAAYAAFSAADFQAPHVRQPKVWLYLSPSLEDEFCSRLEAKPVDSGENVVVLFPDDDGVFYQRDGGETGAGRLACTNLIQTYVDLSHCGGRGEEAAEALLIQRIKPEWKLQGLNV